MTAINDRTKFEVTIRDEEGRKRAEKRSGKK